MYKRFTMQENLVIVESPAKAKTIEKFLGKDFMVKSSFGHIRDLSKKDLGINLADGFAPVYEIPKDKRKVVDELTRAAKDRTVWLASDEDREGEAIAWHLTEVLGLPVEGTKRIVFHEITKRAILEAIENPRTVDMNLVNAQQARRVLDRLVGFELSPVLWKKVRPSLSAGRVQSVAVRLLVEREREIIAFRSTPYFRVVAQFHAAGDKDRTLFKAELPTRFESREEAEAFLRSCVGATFTVAKVEEKPVQRYPAPPFTTSTLQQEAGRKLGMSVSQTMSVAQHLYEQGLITYMRTDSVNLSTLALAQCKEQITNLYGEKYSSYHNYKTKTKGAQEAHEAIRPSYIERQAIEGTPAEKRLYDLNLEAHGRFADGFGRAGPHDDHDRDRRPPRTVRRHGRSGAFRRFPAALFGSRPTRSRPRTAKGCCPNSRRATRCSIRPLRPRSVSRCRRRATTRRRWSSGSKSWASAALRPMPRPSRRSSTAVMWSSRARRGRSAPTNN